MKKFKKANELLWVLGTVLVALGVSICSKANLGVSMIAAPAFILSEALIKYLPFFSVGVTEYLLQGVILITLCVIIRKFNWRFLLAFLVAVIYGYTLNFFIWILGGISINTVLMRWVLLLIGDIITATGVACFFRTYLPLQVYELFVAELSSHLKIDITRMKFIFDMSLLGVSIALAFSLFGDVKDFNWATIYSTSFHSIGLGTLFTTAINSTLIKYSGKLIDLFFGQEPLFKNLEKILKRN